MMRRLSRLALEEHVEIADTRHLDGRKEGRFAGAPGLSFLGPICFGSLQPGIIKAGGNPYPGCSKSARGDGMDRAQDPQTYSNRIAALSGHRGDHRRSWRV